MHYEMLEAATVVLMVLLGAFGFVLNGTHCGTVYFFYQAFFVISSRGN